MKTKLIFIFLSLGIYNFQNITSSFINYFELQKPDYLLDDIIDQMSQKFNYLLGLTILKFFFDFQKVGEIDKECSLFLKEIALQPRNFINNIAQRMAKRGFFSSSMEIEEECIENDELFILVKGNYSLSNIYKNIDNYENQNKLFSEKFRFERELCLWKYCHNLYIDHVNVIVSNITTIMNTLFDIESLELEGINYKINKTTKYREENKKEDLGYYKILKVCFYLIFAILILCTLFSLFLEGKDENDINQNEEKVKEREIESKILNGQDDFSKSRKTVFSNESEGMTNLLYYINV